jgi:hypothetical protein
MLSVIILYFVLVVTKECSGFSRISARTASLSDGFKLKSSKKEVSKVIIPPSYNVAAGFSALSIGNCATNNLWAGIPLGLLAALLTVQTGRGNEKPLVDSKSFYRLHFLTLFTY